MTHSSKRYGARAPAGLALAFALATGLAAASPATVNELGCRFELIAAGPPATGEVRLAPQQTFDAASVEAGSGVASLTPACAFAKLAAGESYSCKVSLTGTPSAAAMTLKVVARRAVPGGRVPVTEVHHLSLKNPAFVPSARLPAASKHVLTSSATTHE